MVGSDEAVPCSDGLQTLQGRMHHTEGRCTAGKDILHMGRAEQASVQDVTAGQHRGPTGLCHSCNAVNGLKWQWNEQPNANIDVLLDRAAGHIVPGC